MSTAATKSVALALIALIVGIGIGYGASMATIKPAPAVVTTTTVTVTGPAKPVVEEVVVASIWPLSGGLARLGEACHKAVLAAAKYINEKIGGIPSLGGAKIKIVTGDTKSDPTAGKAEAERIITTYKPTAALGSYQSAVSLTVSEVMDRYKVPYVTSSISNKLCSRGLEYIFQTSPLATQFGEMQIECLVELGKIYGWSPKKVAIVFENTAYGTDTARGLKATAEKYGLQVVLYEPYPAGITDATDLVLKIKASGAEVVCPVSYLTDAILIVRTMRELKCYAVVNGGGAGYLMPDFIEGAKEAAEYVISVGSWFHDAGPWPGLADLWINKYYVSLYPEEKFIMEHAGEAFADLFLIADAINRAASTDPVKVKEALEKTDIRADDYWNPFHFAAARPYGRVQFKDITFPPDSPHAGTYHHWNIHAHPAMMQIQKGELVTIYPPKSVRPGIKAVWPPPGLVK
ncbi:MAG: ABC transporter substrate-binding protein [Candidatus Bathyarchaeia archaeon]